MCSARFAAKWTASDSSVVTLVPLGNRDAKKQLSTLTILLTATFIWQQCFMGEEAEMLSGTNISYSPSKCIIYVILNRKSSS